MSGVNQSEIEELRLTKEALAASEARLSLVLKGANDGWWDWDLVTNQLFYSPRWWSMLGYLPDELPNDADLWRRLMHPDDLAPMEFVFGSALAQGPDNYETEFRLLTKSGRYMPVLARGHILRDAAGRPVRVSGTTTDLTARKEAEQAVLAANQLAQDAVDGLSARICVLDAKGVLLSVNEAWRVFVAENPSVAELPKVGENYVEACHAEAKVCADMARFVAGLRQVLAGERTQFEMRYPGQTTRGQRWFIARVTRSVGRGEERVIVADEDVSSEVEAEHRISNLNERLSLAIRGPGWGVWEFDVQTGRLIWDEQMYRLYGHTPQTFDGSADAWRACLHPDHRDAVNARFVELMAVGGRIDPFDFSIVRASDGAVRAIEATGYLQMDSEGRPQRLVGINRDVTEQREAQAALHESEQRWKFALEGAGDGVWDWNFTTGEVHYSPRWLEMLGYREHEVTSHYGVWEQLVHPDDAPTIGAAFRAHLAGYTRGFQAELRLRCKDGSWKWVHGRGIVTSRDGQGKPLRVVGTHSDLSDRKEAEQRRAQLEAQLREAQKIEAIGTLAGGVAHDFNNVLAGILGNVELASQDVGEHHPARANLEQIRRASLRARNLVQQILAFSRRQPQLLVSQPLRPLVEESLTLLRATLPSTVQLHTTFDDGPLHVLADATQIQQVLMNLCTNGWHALQGSSGRIEIGLEAAEPGHPQRPADLPSGRFAHLWVGDDGCGMDAATQARIFEPFYTTKPVGQGTGLGLAVVHGIVTAHGGAIRVESAPSQGSRFHLYLPMADAPTETRRPARTVEQPPRGNGQHVLYVDDDELMVVTVQSLLQRAGYRVSTLTDGRAAVEAVRAKPGAFDVIVTDFNMPGFSGVDVVREVARIRPDLPVAISSGYISDELRGQARALGVRGLLHKENTVEELAALVQRALFPRPGVG